MKHPRHTAHAAHNPAPSHSTPDPTPTAAKAHAPPAATAKAVAAYISTKAPIVPPPEGPPISAIRIAVEAVVTRWENSTKKAAKQSPAGIAKVFAYFGAPQAFCRRQWAFSAC